MASIPTICNIDSAYEIADHLLSLLAERASSKTRSNFGRAYVAFGSPVADQCCDGGQLTVGITRVWQDHPEYGRGVCTPKWMMEFEVVTYQCYPIGVEADSITPIKTDILDAASRCSYRIGQALWTSAFDAMAEGTIHPPRAGGEFEEKRDVTIGELRPLDQQSTCVGWRFNITLELSYN
jgi:hypothetical protein